MIYVTILRPGGDLTSGSAKRFAGDAQVRSDHVLWNTLQDIGKFHEEQGLCCYAPWPSVNLESHFFPEISADPSLFFSFQKMDHNESLILNINGFGSKFQ
jgi:hypothetical protein